MLTTYEHYFKTFRLYDVKIIGGRLPSDVFQVNNSKHFPANSDKPEKISFWTT